MVLVICVLLKVTNSGDLPELIVFSKYDVVNNKKAKFSFNVVKAESNYDLECFWYIEHKGLLMKDKQTKELKPQEIDGVICGDLSYNT